MTEENKRLLSSGSQWKKWGPYVSDRQWGTVREDYSPNGDAWKFVTHEMSRSRAYRWGEDGIAGICDEDQYLCLSLALWNGRDRILKERFFGLGGEEGNHGEDVKECYYYLDNTPTHSYMKMLYKYPHGEFPYERLKEENHRRSRKDPEFELIDTGIFNNGEYCDVFVEYAKGSPEDILMVITAHNRGPVETNLNIIPQVVFRNTWSWGHGSNHKPIMSSAGKGTIRMQHPQLGERFLYADGDAALTFCDNKTNVARLFGIDEPGYFKDGLNDCIVDGIREAVNPEQTGTKAGVNFQRTIGAGSSLELRLRLTDTATDTPFTDFNVLLALRRKEADAFYSDLQSQIKGDDARRVQRQAFAGMLWSKQFYYYDVSQWLT
ncbi:MAG: glucosidase, partial [Ignavibacteria bacterium]|nr:glucosidase [Ignavibacteria bacterium]